MAAGKLPDTLAIVTGAGSGIGLATAERLLRRGAVLAIGRDGGKLEQARRALGEAYRPLPLDVSDLAQVLDLKARLEAAGTRVSALVNAAGFATDGSLTLPLEQLAANWQSAIGTNLTGAFQMSAAIAPLLARPGGRIVNVSSIAAYSGGRNKGSSIYAASKSGLHGMTAGFAKELAEEGITVNAVAPGYIADTGFTRHWDRARVEPMLAEIPLGRGGEADEVAALIDFLCAPEAGYITGQIMQPNGGWRVGG